jgi:hypothetical protein
MLASNPAPPPRLLLLCAALGACSTLPESNYPEHRDAEFAVRCRVPASGRLRVPATAADLVVQSLVAEPPPRGERVERDGTRWLLYDGGTAVLLRARLRLYGAPGTPRHARTALFPEAVEWQHPQ